MERARALGLEVLACRLDEARADFEAAVSTEPELGETWVGLGAVAMEHADPGEAVRCFDRALRVQDDPLVRGRRAEGHEAREDWAVALDGLPPDEADERIRLRDRHATCAARARQAASRPVGQLA